MLLISSYLFLETFSGEQFINPVDSSVFKAVTMLKWLILGTENSNHSQPFKPFSPLKYLDCKNMIRMR